MKVRRDIDGYIITGRKKREVYLCANCGAKQKTSYINESKEIKKKKLYEITPHIDLIVENVNSENLRSPCLVSSEYTRYSLGVKLLIGNELFYGSIEVKVSKDLSVVLYFYSLYAKLVLYDIKCIMLREEKKKLEDIIKKIVLESEVKND